MIETNTPEEAEYLKRVMGTVTGHEDEHYEKYLAFELSLFRHRLQLANPKFCVNCRWFVPMGTSVDGGTLVEHACSHPSQVSLVTGEMEMSRCRWMRRETRPCGRDGKLWEAKA